MRFYPHCKWCASKQGGFIGGVDPNAAASKTDGLMDSQQKGKQTGKGKFK